MLTSNEYKNKCFSKDSLNSIQLSIWRWTTTILLSPVNLMNYLKEKRKYSIAINRFKLQQQKRLKKLSCPIRTLKFCVFTYNLLTFIVGAAAISLIAFSITSLPKQHFKICMLGIVVSLVACVIASFGSCGAYRESTICMWTYAVLLLLTLIIEFSIICTFNTNKFVRSAVAELDQQWLKELNTNNGIMAELERTLKCCGLYGANDYKRANHSIPFSCYDPGKPDGSNVFDVGCREVMLPSLEMIGYIIEVTNWIFFGIELTSVIFAYILGRSFGARYQEFHDYSCNM